MRDRSCPWRAISNSPVIWNVPHNPGRLATLSALSVWREDLAPPWKLSCCVNRLWGHPGWHVLHSNVCFSFIYSNIHCAAPGNKTTLTLLGTLIVSAIPPRKCLYWKYIEVRCRAAWCEHSTTPLPLFTRDLTSYGGRLFEGPALWYLEDYQCLCPAASRWLQGFNEQGQRNFFPHSTKQLWINLCL